MKVHFVNDTPMQWEKGFQKVFSGHTTSWDTTPLPPGASPDVTIFMWANQDVIDWINNAPKEGKWVLFVRRWEVYRFDMKSINWARVDAVITVNDYIANFIRSLTNKVHVIYNGVIPDQWTYRKHGHGNNVAWVGYINQKKNIPLALQIMSHLPGYMLHIVGQIQDTQVFHYIKSIVKSLGVKVTLYPHIPHNKIDGWLNDKDYILNTSISEGCPNSVIEAMAKGIKPIVHAWPGAGEQFGNYVFSDIDRAIAMMLHGTEYDSEKYRSIVIERFGFDQYRKVLNLCEGLCG